MIVRAGAAVRGLDGASTDRVYRKRHSCWQSPRCNRPQPRWRHSKLLQVARNQAIWSPKVDDVGAAIAKICVLTGSYPASNSRDSCR